MLGMPMPVDSRPSAPETSAIDPCPRYPRRSDCQTFVRYVRSRSRDDGEVTNLPPRPGGRQLAEARLAMVDARFLADLHTWLRAPLDGCTQGTVRAVGSVVGELVANAFRHAEPPYRVLLATTRYGNLLRMAVTDGTPGTADQWRLGRGLRVVRDLSRRWGVMPDEATGKTVWAELPVTVPPSAVGRFPTTRTGYAEGVRHGGETP